MVFMQHISVILIMAVVVLVCRPAEAPAQTGTTGVVREILQARLSSPAGSLLVDVEGADLLSPGSVRSFYDEHQHSPVWNTGNRFRSLSRDLLAVVRSAGGHGLEPRIYHESFIERIARLPYEQYDAERKVDIELLFTDALLAFANDLLKGRARLVELEDSSIDASEDVDANEVAYAALAAGELQRLVEQLAPAAAAYERLRDALSGLRALEPPEQPFELSERTLHPGDTGGEVAALRRRLVYLGDLAEADSDKRGMRDESLVEAVRRFQSRHGLEVDGIVGPETRAALDTPTSTRIAQVESALERWRWLPRDPGVRYLVVNIAGQELEAVQNGRRTVHMRVIVGGPFQRTPSFASKIDTVVLNPYWEVPYSIAVNEILPKLRTDPDYLARENMQVLKRLDRDGQPIDPADIDWNQIFARNFPYRFRQRPGPGNALGQVKFLMPNPYSVYLHDTPDKRLFSRARRCFSHGCIRLEKPLELADLLLHDEPGWSFERVEKTLDTEQNYRIQLTRAMPVYLVYWTAWVDNEGIVHFRDDVYGRDGRLKTALDELNP